MTEATETSAAAAQRSFVLDHDLKVAGNVVHPAGTRITVRKPTAGELRGLTLSALGQGDYTALETLGPRITSPMLHKQAIAALDPADFMQFGAEVIDFLLPKSARADSPSV